MRIEITPNGIKQLTIDDNCDYADFYLFAELLASLTGINYKNKFDGFDDLYWDFDFEGSEMTLSYNVYLGISINSLKFKDATPLEEQKFIRLLEILQTYTPI
ncbi:uncharacterized protein DUF3630 [Mucilaginibacter gracilis]|uniref:Uncharacterized protein DUF3630 n=1 Tax=Mucilaginibacter gracilis TaxID=423350 RepID=A0A495J9W6_9SPHI|nr:DUF3630 family protein [Mucilaginibacter gracilis]RKR85194.1 uncharacterized protein DUF3630 [Mucilaginibacter gracilis]